jgi:hypothetical protein
MVGHTGKADGAEENRIMISQPGDTVLGHHSAGRSVRFATPGELVKPEADAEGGAYGLQNFQTFRDDFFADAVARNHCNFVSFQQDNPRGKKSAHYNVLLNSNGSNCMASVLASHLRLFY